MGLGMSISSTHPTDDPRDGARWMIERAIAARRAELDFLTVGDSHARSEPYHQGVPMLGRMLAEWDRTRSAGCLFLLPLWNPVLVAENCASLAALIDAPFVLQTGLGGGPARFSALGADHSSRGAALDESIRVIKALLAGETVASERWGLEGAVTGLLPPVPVEWWIGGHAPVALRRAAREGDAWYAGPDLTPVEARDTLARYRQACEASGRPARAVLRRDVLVLADGNRARRLGDELVERGYRGLGPESLVHGGVDEVAERLGELTAIGFADVAVRCMAPDQALALETIELCGELRTRM